MKITCNIGAIFELQSFNTKLGIRSGPGDLLVERLFRYLIPGVEKVRLLISGKLGSKLGTKVAILISEKSKELII